MDEGNGRLEEALAALERELALPVTVIDNAFFLNRKNIFEHNRRSHRKNPACEAGFCERCVRHCRYAMNSRCGRESRPFLAVCWKGLAQIVAPLRHGNIHYGMLYLGLWRAGEPEKARKRNCRRSSSAAETNSHRRRNGCRNCCPSPDSVPTGS